MTMRHSDKPFITPDKLIVLGAVAKQFGLYTKITGGQRIDLTLKEYALLEYLMRHTGRVLTRPMISEHVWNQDFDTFTNVIDVYVNYLRNKIDRGRTKKLIHTIRGSGYMLKAD